MAWYRVVFWREDTSPAHCDAQAFIEDYCRKFRAAGLRIPAAFARRSEIGQVYFINPLASAVYFSGPERSEGATRLLANGAARPCLDTPDISQCEPVTCQ